MQKAFTLAETLITLTIIGVVMAITIPILNTAKPDKDKIFYSKALMSFQIAMDRVMDSTKIDYLEEIDFNTGKISSDYWAHSSIGAEEFCTKVSENLNISGAINCDSKSSYSKPNFKTTDGISFWGLEGKFDSDKTKTIYIDRKLTTQEISVLEKSRDSYHKTPGLKILVNYNGQVKILNTNEYAYERKLVE